MTGCYLETSTAVTSLLLLLKKVESGQGTKDTLETKT
ncbi:uncharacterized protein METZ01_LOCUS131391 [marine metagenome]|uniref:Uncharacterized protein n=1 Tax=marine metagenome TaxID=408172 RepID=A0A381YPV7_9ZZZZ